MSFEPLRGWMPLEELMSLSLAERIRYVRENLPTSRPRARNPHMSHDDFATAVGAPDRQAPMRWEAGGRPRDYAEAIAALTPYPAAAFDSAGEADLVRETLGLRLREVEAALAQVEARINALLVAFSEEADAGEDPLAAARAAAEAALAETRRLAGAPPESPSQEETGSPR